MNVPSPFNSDKEDALIKGFKDSGIDGGILIMNDLSKPYMIKIVHDSSLMVTDLFADDKQKKKFWWH